MGNYSSIEEFRKFREQMNTKLLDSGTVVTKRFFALDTQCYQSGALDDRTKEILGLVASIVLRCDDCITYHLTRCSELEITSAEIIETFDIALIAGGSITIPHLRRGLATWEELLSLKHPRE